MDDSEKASEIRRIAHVKFDRNAELVATELNTRTCNSAAESVRTGRACWEEWKTQLHEDSVLPDARIEQRVKSACFRVLDQLPSDERRTLWLGIDAAHVARPDFFGKTDASELFSELFERVKDLALEQTEKEASFGRGFFQRRGDLLPVVREILELLSRREQLDSETTAFLQQLKSKADSMPDREPTEFLKLMLSLSTRSEDSGGSRTYSLLVTPYGFELDLGGHEWTKEAGGDAWSGPRLAVEADGTHQEDGDIERMLREMLEATTDPNYAH